MDNTISNAFVKNNSKVILFATICAFLTVVTTIGIHSNLFDFGPMGFDQRARLSESSWYHFSKWWVIIHCLMVIFSMWGILLLQGRSKIHLTAIGFLFFCVFSITEIFRQLLALFYLNGLRQKYLNESDSVVKDMIVNNIESFGLIAYSMFGLFILGFALGNFFYGLSLIRGSKWDHMLGIILIIWATQGLITLGNEFWNISWINQFMEWFSLIFQPSVRLAVGFWFVTKIRG